eukprot:m.32987 g.32987  ORF g.32987 m.32987 type:complete len:426 (-) comp9565_c0_seq2:2086-3363(-)
MEHQAAIAMRMALRLEHEHQHASATKVERLQTTLKDMDTISFKPETIVHGERLTTAVSNVKKDKLLPKPIRKQAKALLSKWMEMLDALGEAALEKIRRHPIAQPSPAEIRAIKNSVRERLKPNQKKFSDFLGSGSDDATRALETERNLGAGGQDGQGKHFTDNLRFPRVDLKLRAMILAAINKRRDQEGKAAQRDSRVPPLQGLAAVAAIRYASILDFSKLDRNLFRPFRFAFAPRALLELETKAPHLQTDDGWARSIQIHEPTLYRKGVAKGVRDFRSFFVDVQKTRQERLDHAKIARAQEKKQEVRTQHVVVRRKVTKTEPSVVKSKTPWKAKGLGSAPVRRSAVVGSGGKKRSALKPSRPKSSPASNPQAIVDATIASLPAAHPLRAAQAARAQAQSSPSSRTAKRGSSAKTTTQFKLAKRQ